jgi:hypothetical protein
MDKKFFHGALTPEMVSQALMAEFNQGNLRSQVLGEKGNLIVQIGSSQWSSSGGKTALTVNIQQIEDGVSIQLGEQQWFGIAASLGQSALATILNPINILGRLDDIAQDVSNINLPEKVWQVIANVATSVHAGQELSERLSRITCSFCGVANPTGEPTCIACGAPMGKDQPKSCLRCGFAITPGEKFCPNCGQKIF